MVPPSFDVLAAHEPDLLRLEWACRRTPPGWSPCSWWANVGRHRLRLLVGPGRWPAELRHRRNDRPLRQSVDVTGLREEMWADDWRSGRAVLWERASLDTADAHLRRVLRPCRDECRCRSEEPVDWLRG